MTKRVGGKAAPVNGSIRMLMVTEHQFADMYVAAGEKKAQEIKNTAKQLTFF